MGDKPLAELTVKEFDDSMKLTRISGIVVTLGVIVALGYLVLGLLEKPQEAQLGLILILLSFAIIGLFGLAVSTGNQYLRLRRDLWDVLQKIDQSGS